MHTIRTILLLSCMATLCCNPVKNKAGQGKKAVQIKLQNGQYRIYRYGTPYYVNGVCTQDTRYLSRLKENGGNSVRVHNTGNAGEILDSAQRLGLTVMIGLELEPAGPHMDYTDEKAVNAQFDRIKKEVLRYRHHPALLMWSIGNEVGLKLSPGNFFAESRLWIHINKIARMIHELDPDHPATAAIEGAGKLLYVSLFCKNLDLISINSYKSVDLVQQRIKQLGWNRPYIISEYGSGGYWFNEQTDWYTYIEQTSNEKQQFIVDQYKAIRSDTKRCLGSYAFYWGQKNESTPTYFSMFTESGEQTELVDGLHYAWNGKWPEERAPSIYSLVINNQKSTESIYLEPGKKYMARFRGGPQQNARLRWQVEKDDGELYFDPTKNEEKRQVVATGILSVPAARQPGDLGVQKSIVEHQFVFEAPAMAGPYRLFLFLENGRKAATANACFYVHD